MSRAKRGFKRVMASVAMEAVLEGVRGYLMELLSDTKPEDLYKAIQEDTDPWDFAPSRVKRVGGKWAREMRKYQDRITPQLVLSWLQADRPDLHSLIINMGPTGTRWRGKRVRRIKKQLWPAGIKLISAPHEDEEKRPEPEESPPKIRWG